MALVLLGAWGVILGYGVLWTGVQKLSGDTGCTIGKAFRGQCKSQAEPGTPAAGTTGAQAARAAAAQQAGILSSQPLAGAAA